MPADPVIRALGYMTTRNLEVIDAAQAAAAAVKLLDMGVDGIKVHLQPPPAPNSPIPVSALEEIVLARIEPSERRSPLTRTIVPFASCEHDSPFRTVVLSIQIIVAATVNVSTGHDPLTAFIAPSTWVSRTATRVAATVLVPAAGEAVVVQVPSAAIAVESRRVFTGISRWQAFPSEATLVPVEDRCAV